MTKHTPEKEPTTPSHDEIEGYPEKRKAYYEKHLADSAPFEDINNGPVPLIGDQSASVGETALNTLAPETNIPLSRDELSGPHTIPVQHP